MATITDKAMQARPGTRDRWLTHSLMRGAGALAGRITPAGERLFYFRYTDANGQRRLLAIGPYHPRGAGGITLAQAFDRAAELSALYRAGTKDLHAHFEQVEHDRRVAAEQARLAAEQAVRDAEASAAAAARRLTVRNLFDQWQRTELVPRRLADGSRTGRKDGGQWVRESFDRRVFPRIGDMAAEDVGKADLLAILDDCKAEGRRRMANVLLADLRQMFRFAEDRDIVRRNPLAGIKRSSVGGKDVERDRVLTDDEISALARAVPEARMAARSAAAIWLILSTAVRVGEAMNAKWEEIDFTKRTWYLPETKNQRDHVIHLSDFAMRQLHILLGLRDTDPEGRPVAWVFPNTRGTGPVDVKSIGKQVADRQRDHGSRLPSRSKQTDALKLEGGRWTLHDLRRSAATIMARLGISVDVIDECLNHKLRSKAARVYVKDRRLEQQRHAFDALGSHLTRVVAANQIAAPEVAQQEGRTLPSVPAPRADGPARTPPARSPIRVGLASHGGGDALSAKLQPRTPN